MVEGINDWEGIEYTRTRSLTRTQTVDLHRGGRRGPAHRVRLPEEERTHRGRLVVRRIPELNKKNLDQLTLFDVHRFYAFFTTSDLNTVTADKTHRGHATVEQVRADLKNSALAH
jgi:hypothetical protein